MNGPTSGSDAGHEPFLEVPGGDPSRPRILLVSWHFPPATSAGALRWERLGEHAARRGWVLDVLTRHPDDLDRRDDAHLAGLPAGTRVFGVRATEPPESRLETVLHGLWRGIHGEASRGRDPGEDSGSDEGPGPGSAGSLSRAETRLYPWSIVDLRRAWFAWVEHRREARWAAAAVDAGRRILANRNDVRVIVSCGPPHMSHEAARRLAVAASLPFVMDLRDPWSQVQRLPEHHASPVWYRLADRYERRCVREAALVVANTEPAREALARRYPHSSDRVIAVLNGFDDRPVPQPVNPDRFIMAHAGTVYLDRDPRPLFRALARLTDERALGPDRLSIRFYGCTDAAVRRLAEEAGVGDYVELIPFLPREELERRLVECAVLVVLPQDSDLAIPSKVFDYMRYPSWILAIAEDDSATGRVLRDTPAEVRSAADVEGLATCLSAWFAEFQRGSRPAPVAKAAPGLSRRAQADRLFDRLERFR